MEILDTIDLGSSAVVLRRAEAGDVPAIVGVLADDPLGATRDGAGTAGDLAACQAAFAPSTATRRTCWSSGNQARTSWPRCSCASTPACRAGGALRAQIEAVRVDEAYRGHGLGAAFISWAINEARRRHCALVQLTTDKSRTSAHRFYERLGFAASHEGMKLSL